MKIILASVALAGMLASHGAHAGASAHDAHHQPSGTTFDFFFEHGSPWLDTTSVTPNFVEGGLNLSVNAKVGGTPGLVDIRVDGLGVTYNSWLNAGAITKGESLQFVFDRAVSLNSLSLSGWSSLVDHATLSWGDQVVALGADNEGITLNTFRFDNAIGNTFTLSGVGALTAFRLAGLNVSAVGAVPEPATWGLMGLGLIGIAGLRRARRQS